MTKEIKEIQESLDLCIEMDSPSIVIPLSTIEKHFPATRLSWMEPDKPCYKLDDLKEWAEAKGWEIKFATTPSANGKRILPAIRFIPSDKIKPIPDAAPNPTGKNTNNEDSWYQKPIGIIGIGVIIVVIGAFSIYFIKTHLGIPLY